MKASPDHIQQSMGALDNKKADIPPQHSEDHVNTFINELL